MKRPAEPVIQRQRAAGRIVLYANRAPDVRRASTARTAATPTPTVSTAAIIASSPDGPCTGSPDAATTSPTSAAPGATPPPSPVPDSPDAATPVGAAPAADAQGSAADGSAVTDAVALALAELRADPDEPDEPDPRLFDGGGGAAAGWAAGGFAVTPTVTARNSSTTPALHEMVIDTSTGPWWNTTGTAWFAPTDVTVLPPIRSVAFWPSRLTNDTWLSAGTVSLPVLGCDLQTSMFSTLPPLNSTFGGPAGAADATPAISAGPVPSTATRSKRTGRKLPDRKRVYITIQRFGGEQCTARAAHRRCRANRDNDRRAQPVTRKLSAGRRRLACMRIGAHVDREDPLAAATERKADVVQFFLSDPQAWVDPEERSDAAQLVASDIDVFVHAPYRINVATMNNRIRIPSRKLLFTYSTAAATVGAKGLIVHGGHVEKPGEVAKGIDNWRKTFAYAQEQGGFATPILIENTAGGDNACARRLDALARLWDAVGEFGVGFCLDTCHAHAGGEELLGIVDRVKAITGRIDLIHANDSRDPFDSRRDRHDNIGNGEIDPDLIVAVIRAAGAPVVVETPGGAEGQGGDIAFLRDRLG